MELKDALAARRSYYAISAESPVSDKEIKEIVDFAVLRVPSAFNSQSARLALLLGKHHDRFWEIVREALRKLMAEDSFAPTDGKISSFKAGRGTVLFYEDQEVIADLQRDYPRYKDSFTAYSLHSAGMHQLAVWVMLREAGLGASLQHYGNLVEAEAAKEWKLPASWRLIAQMPFGKPLSEPAPKDRKPLSELSFMFA
ncbi:MAG: nitroreductase family protein [Planctomycetota bacterium]|jgi:predicted oxidoreductase (fatty acid repression mutant protein)|nr:nitroreductase family protein [Planctomycetota bacterium]